MADMLLVGLGAIGHEYARILLDLKINILAIGRSEKSCFQFTANTGIPSLAGGLTGANLNSEKIPKRAIVAVSENELGATIKNLIKIGCKNILVEKPGFSTIDDLNEICLLAREHFVDIRVGYNRRFYASVIKAREIVELDGGIQSFNFEFTEWSHSIGSSDIDEKTKNNWFWHNSTHILDLAFYFGGQPRVMSSFVKPGLSWHKNSIYVGAGITVREIPFSYIANWMAPGRWGLEIQTLRSRLIFRPIEELQIQSIGSIDVKKFELNNEVDKKYKPGFFLQVKTFLEEPERLLSILDQQSNCEIFNQINKINY